MNRKDYEAVCRVLGECQRYDARPSLNVIPSAEWMRRRIGIALCEVFQLQGDAKQAFMRSAKLETLPPR